MINRGFKQIVLAVAKILVHKVTNIEKEEVEFLTMCHLMERGLTNGENTLFFENIINILFETL